MPKQLNLLKFNKDKIFRFPRLDTVLMVEEFIMENGGNFKKRSLWESLPRKVMYQTYCAIIDYLIYSGKIAIDNEGKICWIWDPDGVKYFLSKSNLHWRKKK